jgi:hypothetical protein
MQADDVLASTERYDLTGRLDRQFVTICGIAAVLDYEADDNGSSYEPSSSSVTSTTEPAGPWSAKWLTASDLMSSM